MVSMGRQTYSYAIDASDRIIYVSPEWLAFAAENNARELTKPAVLGHQLWEFIAGEDTIRLYRELLERVRETHRETRLPFRCDSPTLQRHMRMTIVPQPDEGIRFNNVIEKVCVTPRLDLLDRSGPRSPHHVDMCSCCKRIVVEPFGWLDIADAAARMNLLDAPQVPELRQKVCPDCRRQVEAAGSSASQGEGSSGP
jgi:hypothetical protein